MIEAAMIWNEPNNKSHWDPELDPELGRLRGDDQGRWSGHRRRDRRSCRASWAACRRSTRCSSSTSQGKGVLDNLDVVAVHGFPLDWNHWQIDDWPAKLDEIRGGNRPAGLGERGRRVDLRRGGSAGVRLAADGGTADRPGTAHSLVQPLRPAARLAGDDPPPEAEGSSYYRHFYMGLLREDGSPKLALKPFPSTRRRLGLCQWFHFEDPRLDDAVRWMRRLGVGYLRTGLSWADSFRPSAMEWFDRQMAALEPFDVTVTFCFTPEHRGIAPHHTSPPQWTTRSSPSSARR